jgi:hypothetical protein
MKFLRILMVLVVSFVSLQAMARQPVPVINYEDVLVSSASGQRLTPAQVKQAIQSAAAAKQWVLRDQGPGRMLATLNVRGKHTVMTEITYSPEKFSVVYNDSTNMDYSPGPDGKGSIHPFYNRWVQDLKEAIRTSLAKG